MALDFPNAPTDGLVYTSPTGEQWTYEAATNSWTSKGLVNNSGGLKYVGTIDITAAPPAGATGGAMYTVQADGTANAGFGPGVTGALTKGDSILNTGAGWIKLSHPSAAWVVNGNVVSPAVANDVVTVSAGTAAAPVIQVGTGATTKPGLYSPGADQLAISTGGTGRVFVAADGKVGLGSASPASSHLDVFGNGATKALSLRYPADSNNPARVAAEVTANVAGVEATLIQVLGDGSIKGQGTTGLIVRAPDGSETFRSTPDKYLRLAAGTGGIQFGGDTAAANALNDYEEGTWTPNVGGTATYSDQTGFYTKVGRTVIASFKLRITTLGTGSAFNVSGIPFAASDVGRGGVYFYHWTNLAVSTVTLAGLLSTNSFDISGQGLAASGIDYQKPVLGDGTRVDGMLVYQVV